MLSPRPWRRSALALLGLFLASPGLAQLPEEDWQWGHPSPQGNPIFGLAFDGQQTGWAVARGGQVLRTDDGALSWQLIQPLGAVSDDLLDIAAPSSPAATASTAARMAASPGRNCPSPPPGSCTTSPSSPAAVSRPRARAAPSSPPSTAATRGTR